MALEDIFNALEEQGKAECDKILADARIQADGIVTDCDGECVKIRDRHVAQREREVRSRVTQSVNSARLEAKKGIAAVKEAAVSRSFDAARDRLSSVRAEGGYPALFRALLEEAASGVEGSIEVQVDPADESLAKQALESMGIDAPVRTDISTAGGVVVLLEDGRIARRNTLEDRLEKVRHTSQAQVAGILFS